MSLQEKVLSLKLNAALAVKHANGWQRLIDLYGEDKATEFYKHLGLNHLEKKSIEWEGLKLSREPKEYEKLCVKGIAGAQESSKEAIGKILLRAREELISDGLKGIKKLDPASYHELILSIPAEARSDLRDRLVKVHKQGRMLVASELGNKADGAVDDEFDDLDTLTDVTGSRVANDVQSRITAAAARFALLGLVGGALLDAVRTEVEAGSVGYIDRASTGLANRVINIGRSDEAERRRDQWGRVEYSALLDQNVCGPCAAQDGQEASNESDLQPAPNPECQGGDWCRCFHVFVQD